MKSTNLIKYSLLITVIFTTSCTDYWWSRGQPPAVSALLKKSQNKLELAESESKDREELVEISKKIKDSLLASLENPNQLTISEENLKLLEGKLSFGSRPAYGELAGQLRLFKKTAQSKSFSKEAFTLYTSRVFDFLANELSVSYDS